MIRQRIGSTFALVVLLFAFVGFGYKLVNNPSSLFSQLLFFGITAGIIFLLFKFLTRNRSVGSGTNAQYRKSVAQSKKCMALRILFAGQTLRKDRSSLQKRRHRIKSDRCAIVQKRLI